MHKKRVSYLHRTAQPPTLATFRSLGSSVGAGRIRLTQGAKVIRCLKKATNNYIFSLLRYLIAIV